jgi:hypothetical protein
MLLIALLVAAGSPPTALVFQNGNSLYAPCSASKADPLYDRKRSECHGYIIGQHDMLSFIGSTKHVFCGTTEETDEQVFDIVTRYLRDHPGDRGASATAITERALTQAFSCN